MGLETGTYISDLVATNPLGTDAKSQGDDHIRLLKSTIKATFPNVAGAVTPTHTELNYVDGVTSAIQTQIDAKGAHAGQAWTGNHTFPTQSAGDNSTKAATTAYVDAADALKANLASPTFTGTPSGPTAASSTNTTQFATCAFVQSVALNAALPNQSGKNGYFLSSNGTDAGWTYTLATQASAEAGLVNTGLMTELRTAQAIAALAPGWEDVGSATIVSGDTAESFTGISTVYKDLLVVFEAVVISIGSSTVTLAVGNATPTYSSAVVISDLVSSALFGAVLLTDVKADYGSIVAGTAITASMTSPAVAFGPDPAGPAIARRVTGGVRAIRLGLSSGTFTSGVIRLRGRR